MVPIKWIVFCCLVVVRCLFHCLLAGVLVCLFVNLLSYFVVVCRVVALVGWFVALLLVALMCFWLVCGQTQ